MLLVIVPNLLRPSEFGCPPGIQALPFIKVLSIFSLLTSSRSRNLLGAASRNYGFKYVLYYIPALSIYVSGTGWFTCLGDRIGGILY